ncbi:hypothetical protein LUZ60_017740 [Juncus effusus]|nr:hypothetical protein LUZ60_017740 [Juncus effusus]
MAQLIVSCVVDKLADLLIEESNFFFRSRSNEAISDKINEVKTHLNRMSCSLKEAESKRKVDRLADRWICDVLDVTYQTDDTIDRFLVEINRARRYEWVRVRDPLRVAGGGIMEMYINDPHGCLISSRLDGRMRQLQAKIRVIHETRTFWARILGQRGGEARPLFLPRVPPLGIVNTEIVGFGDEKQIVVNALLSGDSGQSLQAFSIVGPGGAGKTTLAWIVYNSEEVKHHFNFRIWLPIWRDFKPGDIFKKLLGIFTEARGKELVGDDAENCRCFMRSRRCLIVLDDVLTDEIFQHLAMGLPDVAPGSKVLITSRANLAHSSSMQHKVQSLNKEESLRLFVKKALPSRNTLLESDELFPLAEELCERTGGLPLALVVLGKFVSTKPPTYGSWLKVVDSFDWHSDGNRCMEILASSYEDLPEMLKACFRYFACFPKNHEIYAKYLYKLWIAEGFIVSKGMVTLEEIAKAYLENLVQRSMVQVGEYSDGAIKSCRVHNLLHEVAVYEAKKLDFLLIYGKEKMQSYLAATRRVAIHHHLDANNSLIKTLRHVHGSKPRNQLVVPDGPSPDARLVKLQTLATFNVPKSWKNGLPHLPGLRKLALTYTKTEGPKSKPDWRIVTLLLGNLRNIMSLVIHGEHIPSRILDVSISPSYQNIRRISLCGNGSKLSLGRVEMPPNLTKLTLVEVELDQDPMPKLAELKHLEVLQLRSVITVKAMVCPAEGFPELRKLEMDGCSAEEEFKVHEGSMPKLTNRIIQNCSEHISHQDL